MKNALLIDLSGSYDLIAGMLPLRPDRYTLTVTSTWFDALAFVTEREFDLVIFKPLHRCSDSIWPLVVQLSERSLGDAVVMVQVDQPDEAFYTQAAQYGAVVLSVPKGYVAVPSTHEIGAWGNEPS